MNIQDKQAILEERAICLFGLAQDWQDMKISDSEFICTAKYNLDLWTTKDMIHDGD